MSPKPALPDQDQAAPPLLIDFDRSIAFLVSALANKLSIAASRRLRRQLDLGLMEWRVIVLLAVEGQATPGRVAQVAGVDKSVVSRAVGSLAHRGLIDVLADQHLGRQTSLALTDAGRVLHDKGIVDALAAEAELQHGLSEDDRRQLLRLMKLLTGNLPRVDRHSSAVSPAKT